ncbi:MAG: right-handed parallel beta-helix repeat-containing protein, partial [Planctomycetota bacterium]
MCKKLLYLMTFVVLLALLTAPASATTYYVDQNHTNADDDNAGTSESAPWETLTKACETLVAGDTVYVKAGTYIDTVNQWYKKFHVTNNGTASNPITFISSPPRAAVVRSASLPSSRSDYAWGLGGGSEYIIIDGFKIEGGIVVAYDRADYCTIRNCELIYGWCASDPTLNWGITLYWANNCTVENNYVHDITSSGSGSRNAAGIMLFGDPSKIEFREPCQYNVFQGNTVDVG